MTAYRPNRKVETINPMTSVSSPIDPKTISHILQRMNSTQDATRACLDVVPDPADTPLLHVAYLHAAETLIPSLHHHYSHGAHDEEGERVPDCEMQYRSATRVDDGQITGAVNLFFLTSLRTIAAWANQYPEEAEDAEFDAKGRLAGCETEQLFISRSRAENVKAVRQVFDKRMDHPLSLPAENLPFVVYHLLELLIEQADLNLDLVQKPHEDPQHLLYFPEMHYRDITAYMYFYVLLQAV